MENKKVWKYLKGLRANIFDLVAMMRSNTYAKALEHAQLVEELFTAHYRHIHNDRAQH